MALSASLLDSRPHVSRTFLAWMGTHLKTLATELRLLLVLGLHHIKQ